MMFRLVCDWVSGQCSGGMAIEISVGVDERVKIARL